MSKISLLVVEGYGQQGLPRIPGSEERLDIEVVVPDTHDISAILRTDHDPDSDGSRVANPLVYPVIRPERVNFLLGNLLTLSDALFGEHPDNPQRVARNNLIRNLVWQWYDSQIGTPTRPRP